MAQGRRRVFAHFHRLRVGSENPRFSAARADEQVVVREPTLNFVGSFAVPKQVILLEIPEVQILSYGDHGPPDRISIYRLRVLEWLQACRVQRGASASEHSFAVRWNVGDVLRSW